MNLDLALPKPPNVLWVPCQVADVPKFVAGVKVWTPKPTKPPEASIVAIFLGHHHDVISHIKAALPHASIVRVARGSTDAVRRIKNQTGVDLTPWYLRGIWTQSTIGKPVLAELRKAHAAANGTTSYADLTDAVNKATRAAGWTHAFTTTTIEYALEASAKAPKAPKPKVLVPPTWADFEESLRALLAAPPIGMRSLTITIAPDGHFECAVERTETITFARAKLA